MIGEHHQHSEISGGKFRRQTQGVNTQQNGTAQQRQKTRHIVRSLFIPSRLSSAERK